MAPGTNITYINTHRLAELQAKNQSRAFEFFIGLVYGFLIGAAVVAALWPHVASGQTVRVGSYAKQASNGAPPSVDSLAVALLSKYDDATLEATPWAQDVDGHPRTDVLMRLHALNPDLRLWLYVLTGDQWLPPGYPIASWDHSGFADIYKAIDGGENPWLYDTLGRRYLQNFRVNLADSSTVRRLGDVYVRMVNTRLFAGIFLDCASTSIAWTSKPDAPLDYRRAGFNSLASMDSARLANVEALAARLHAAGGPCFLVAANGTAPGVAGIDVDMREGLGRSITVADAIKWAKTPGFHWLKGECYSPAECASKLSSLRGVAVFARNRIIISCGPDRDWPPVGR